VPHKVDFDNFFCNLALSIYTKICLVKWFFWDLSPLSLIISRCLGFITFLTYTPSVWKIVTNQLFKTQNPHNLVGILCSIIFKPSQLSLKQLFCCKSKILLLLCCLFFPLKQFEYLNYIRQWYCSYSVQTN